MRILLQKIQNQQIHLILGLLSAATVMNFHDKSGFMLWFKYVSIVLLGIQAWRPKYYFASLCSLFIAALYYALSFPRLANHSVLEFFTIAAVFFGLAWFVLFRKKLFPTPLTPTIFRLTLISIYWYAGFHKLNADYFNLQTSCAISINDLIIDFATQTLELKRNLVLKTLIVATFIVEMIVPFGLLFKNFRKSAAVILLLFHTYLSIRVFADFSSFAVFLLAGCLLDFSDKPLDKSIIRSFKIYSSLVIVAVLIETLLTVQAVPKTTSTIVHGLIYTIGVLFLFISIFRTETIAYRISNSQRVALLCIPLAVTIWSIRPYFGLGNTANLTMFSNLITEKSRSNHFLIATNQTKITNWEEDYVEIVQMPNELKSEKLEGYLLPKQELAVLLRYYATRFPKDKLPAVLIYRGKKIDIPDLKTSAFAEYKRYYKYVFFRRIPKEGPCPCLW